MLEAEDDDLHSFVVRLLTAVARDPDELRGMEAFGDLSFEFRGKLGDEIQKVSMSVPLLDVAPKYFWT